MSIAIRTTPVGQTAINAAFLQEVKESHAELWDLLHRLRLATEQGMQLSIEANRWVMLLDEVRERLASEFSLEETYGYLSQAGRAACRTDATTLRGQHAELYVQLSELCERAEEAQYRGTIIRDFPEFAAEFRRFDQALQRHEQAEAAAIRMGLGLDPAPK